MALASTPPATELACSSRGEVSTANAHAVHAGGSPRPSRRPTEQLRGGWPIGRDLTRCVPEGNL
eukprot:5214045-Lingulodinium_polyedra.AAC.1